MINIIVDSNAWNFLHVSGISLSNELLSDYNFQITLEVSRELQELEGKEGKEALYEFFVSETQSLEEPLCYFGFYDESVPADEQRFGGFGVGGFSSVHQDDFFQKTVRQIKSSKRGVYYGNEADMLIGSRGFGNTFILTEDNNKSGPMKEAENTIFVSRKSPMTVEQFKEYLDLETSKTL
ncbi:hypothetical protein [Enterobacter quasiroggenkampii]|uniref:hypothetical protein n=1 Tax=Enterobacter quasiroggenkampii TaxID=2497436 RepID=UPI0021D138E0|nr:hypothetical protein [Enterobacter quasiroggenkampii]MCU6407444.1 hypothetical protein [Enterobacter quasiroggenkampii]